MEAPPPIAEVIAAKEVNGIISKSNKDRTHVKSAYLQAIFFFNGRELSVISIRAALVKNKANIITKPKGAPALKDRAPREVIQRRTNVYKIPNPVQVWTAFHSVRKLNSNLLRG